MYVIIVTVVIAGVSDLTHYQDPCGDNILIAVSYKFTSGQLTSSWYDCTAYQVRFEVAVGTVSIHGVAEVRDGVATGTVSPSSIATIPVNITSENGQLTLLTFYAHMVLEEGQISPAYAIILA